MAQNLQLNADVPEGESQVFGASQGAPIMTIADQLPRLTVDDILNETKRLWPPQTKDAVGQAMLQLQFYSYGRKPSAQDKINFAKLYRIVIATGAERGSEEQNARWISKEVKQKLGMRLRHLINKLRVDWLKGGTIINYNGVLLSKAEADRRRDAIERSDTPKKKALQDAIARMDKAHLEWAIQEIARQIGSQKRVSELITGVGDDSADNELDIDPTELPSPATVLAQFAH